ncbi:helix-turn-helix transcriptional regulator [Mycobacterium attenuatum]|uniref:helix-turn-helix transcriptional regulator n=1 Tax=Mycobacterium attenuatum TaxID=2341086 RepID=UPI000F2C833C|nr:helix-turn-helix transcriptional regulator [Mycobacterium attenuatum]VBA52349.1 HTH-type transcriptional activator RhaS [Mycobacterium attenuatum]
MRCEISISAGPAARAKPSFRQRARRATHDLDFDSSDVAETEHFLARAYTRMRINGDGGHCRARIRRRCLGAVSLDELAFSYDMSYDANPLGKVLLCWVRSGRIEENFIGEPQHVFGPGELALIGPPELPHSGRIRQARYQLTGFDPALLDRVAASAPDGADEPVRLTGHRPVTAAAGNRLSAFVDYLRDHVLADPGACSSPLVIETAAAHLAVAALNAFPRTALLDPTATDRRDSAQPVLLRRAIAFIEENAHKDVALTDIAAHVYVTPRALQYMFRQRLDCTPMQYLRRVRLERAHRELMSSSPATATVKQVANRWGFTHIGRFAIYYRQAYGRPPHASLRT